MTQRTRILVLTTLIAGVLLSLRGSAAEPPSSTGRSELSPPAVRILSGERMALSDVRFFSFSCEASNPNKSPLMFVGYRPDSFDPPIERGTMSPIHSIQFQRDGKWEEHPQGWCGTGIDGIELPKGAEVRVRGPGGFGGKGGSRRHPLEPAPGFRHREAGSLQSRLERAVRAKAH